MIVSTAARIKHTDTFTTLLLGLFGLTTLLLIEHFFMPIANAATIVPLSVAAIGWLIYIKNKPTLQLLPLWPVMIVSASMIILLSYLPGVYYIHYDTGLYHAQKVLWYNEAAVWPGLGLLHGRFGFNVSFFLPVSFFNQILPFANTLHYSVSSFWIVAFALYLIKFASSPNTHQNFLAAALFIAICIYPFVSPGVWGFSPDPIITVTVLYLYSQILQSLTDNRIETLPVVLLVSALALSVKLSGAILLLPVVGLFIRRDFLKSLQKGIAGSITLSVLLLLVWGFHGYLESGYVSYPASITFGSPAWQIPETDRIAEVTSIREWARSRNFFSNTPTFDFSWISNWFLDSRNWPILLPAITSATISLITIAYNPKRYRKQAGFFGLLLVSFAAWLLAAPDRRFGLPILLFLAAFPLLLLPKAIKAKLLKFTDRRLIVSTIILAHVIIFSYRFVSQPYQFQPLPVAKTNTTIINGLPVSHPVDTDQCWFTQRPCTPARPQNIKQTEYQIGPLKLRGYGGDNEQRE